MVGSPVEGTVMFVSRAWAGQVAVAWVVDAPRDRSMTVTRVATEGAAPTAMAILAAVADASAP
ncbi:hypothetical protein AB4Z42_08610 [Mycobacterium sp. 2YAF39]|uniref:hypothetical protein n=1 Tax=Mycobacterium sp. 2YAF39 TaxID=3233033 RepID=UPI003F9D4C93